MITRKSAVAAGGMAKEIEMLIKCVLCLISVMCAVKASSDQSILNNIKGSNYSEQPYTPGRILIKNVNIVDPGSLNSFKKNRNVLIEDGIIVGFPSNVSLLSRDNLTVIDGSGRYLMPGLVDAHVHIAKAGLGEYDRPEEFTQDELDLFLAYGVTTIRNMKSLETNKKLREEIKLRQRLGPRLLLASPAADDEAENYQNGSTDKNYVCRESIGWSNCTIITEKGIEQFVSDMHGSGFDLIKIRQPLKYETLSKLSVYARKLKIPIAGHVWDYEKLPLILRETQIDSIEHMDSYLNFSQSSESPMLSAEYQGDDFIRYTNIGAIYPDTQKREELAKAASKFKGYMVPTLSMEMGYILAGIGKIDVASSPYAVFRDKCSNKVIQSGVDEWYTLTQKYRDKFGEDLFSKIGHATYEMVRLLKKAGAQFATGTDLGPEVNSLAGVSLHEELEHLVQAGLPTIQVLKAATVNGAKLLNVKKLGLIRKNYLADLIILSANPLDNISNTRKIDYVIRDGMLIDSTQIEKALEKIKLHAAEYSAQATCM